MIKSYNISKMDLVRLSDELVGEAPGAEGGQLILQGNGRNHTEHGRMMNANGNNSAGCSSAGSESDLENGAAGALLNVPRYQDLIGSHWHCFFSKSTTHSYANSPHPLFCMLSRPDPDG